MTPFVADEAECQGGRVVQLEAKPVHIRGAGRAVADLGVNL